MSDEYELSPHEAKMFERASALVVGAATALAGGQDLQAHAFLNEAKAELPIETIDFLFGAFVGLMTTLSEAVEVDFGALISLYALRTAEEALGMPLSEGLLDLPGSDNGLG